MMDDDLVVVEGTPLADHLQLVGFEEDIEGHSCEERQIEEALPLWRRLWTRISNNLLPSKESFIRDAYQEVSIDTILQSNVLEESDVTPILIHRGFNQSVTEQTLPWLFLKRALLEAAIVMVPCIAAGFWRKRSLLSLLIIIATPAAAILCPWLPAVCASRDFKSLKKYLNSVKLLHEKLRAASRLINEMSLINQGYLLSERNAEAAWRLETKSIMAISRLSEKSLPGLRIALIGTTSRLALAYSQELQILRKSWPLRYHMDHPSLSLPPVDLYAIASIRIGENDNIPELRDIKKTMDIAMLKEQEYIKRLLLKMLTDDKDSYSVQIGPKLIYAISSAILELEMALILNQTLFCSTYENLPKVASKPIEDDMGVLYSMCRSSRFHLMECFRGAQSMEDTLEINDLSILSRKGTMILLLDKVNFHMESAKECLQRISILVERGSCRKSNSSNTVPERKEQDQFNGVNASEECPMSSDIVPRDQIFEVIGEKVSSEDEDEDVCMGASKDKSDKESSQMMMRELRTVLRVKARDWEEREKKLRSCVPSAGEELPTEMELDDDLTSPSSSTVKGSHNHSGISTWVIPGVVESGNVCSLVADVRQEGTELDPNLLGSIATQAVAIAVANQGFGMMCGEEDFIVSGDED